MCVAKEDDVPQVFLHTMAYQEEAVIRESTCSSFSSNRLAVDTWPICFISAVDDH